MRAPQGFIASLLLGLSSATATADTTGSMELQLGTVVDDSGVALLRQQIEGVVEASLSDVSQFTGSVRLRLDPINEYTRRDDPDWSGYDNASKPSALSGQGMMELRDFYIDWSLENSFIRLGKQQVVWGQLDGFKIMDQVNPQSFEQFILEDFADSRIGQWSAYAQIPLGSHQLELVLTPDETVSELPDPRDTFFFNAPRFTGNVDPLADRVITIDQTKADTVLGSGSYAVRYTHNDESWDGSIAYLEGLDHQPVFALRPVQEVNVLDRRYEKRRLLAAAGSAAIGEVVIRSEWGYYIDRSFNVRAPNRQPEIMQLDQLTGSVAADFFLPSSLFISAQLIYDRVLDADPFLTRPQDDWLWTIAVKKSFWGDEAELDTRWYTANGVSEDALWRTRMTYNLSDDTLIALEFDHFQGSQDGIYGQFNHADRFAIRIESFL